MDRSGRARKKVFGPALPLICEKKSNLLRGRNINNNRHWEETIVLQYMEKHMNKGKNVGCAEMYPNITRRWIIPK